MQLHHRILIIRVSIDVLEGNVLIMRNYIDYEGNVRCIYAIIFIPQERRCRFRMLVY